MQKATLGIAEPLTLEALEKRISAFFNDSKILKQKQFLSPKEETCRNRETD
jgi:hypothetical protein